MFPLIPIVLALWAVACHREEDAETKSGPLIIGPEPMSLPSNKSPNPFKQKGEQAVETYFNKLCQGYFSNKQDNPQQFCSRLWRNQSLPAMEKQIRDKVFSYATHPLSSDLDPQLSYQELKIRPILEKDLGKLSGRD
jgi:hypothetical protein